MRRRSLLTGLVAAGVALPAATFADADAADDDVLRPYTGPTAPGVDRTTLAGKVLAGYQGWFTTPGDGSGRAWAHYQRGGRFEPGHCSIDLWPDVSELADDEKFATPFRHADGSTAYVFSSHRRATVLRHFQWLRQYGLDGVFLQRFAVETLPPLHRRHCDVVLSHCRAGANRHGRGYALMYDLSGLRRGQTRQVSDDWRRLVDRLRLGRDPGDPAYLRHGGRPVVAVWGVGFNDNRQYTLDECRELIRFLKHDEQYGGNTVLVGVPAYWRTLDRDSIADPRLHDVLREADIISPWTVGRYDSPAGAARHARDTWRADLAWCQQQGVEYLPVAFPGFSWRNLRGGAAPLNQIPRRGGQLLWSQFVGAREAGATMLYVAMFDELDEATAIFKCVNTPPVGASPFVDFEGLPSDHYLWLTGQGGRLIRGELPITPQPPPRE